MPGAGVSTTNELRDFPTEDLGQVLYRTAAAHELDVGLRAARLAISKHRPAETSGRLRHDVAETLRGAGEEVGLTLVATVSSIDEVLAMVSPRAPWIGLGGEATGDGDQPLLVLDVGRRGVRIGGMSADSDRWVSREELCVLLGVSAADEPLMWVTGEQAAPLDVMRSPLTGSGNAHDGRPGLRLRALLRVERHDLWVVVVYSVVIGLLSLVLPIAVQSLVNSVAFGNVLQPLFVLTLFVLVALGFSAVIRGFRLLVVEIIQRRIFARVSADFTQRLVRARAEAFDRHFGPELVNRFFDVATVQKSGALLLIDGLSLGMQTLVGLVVLAVYHPLLLVFDIILVLVMLYILFGLGRGAVSTAIKESKAKYSTAAWLEEVANNQVTFKSLGGARYAAERSDGLVREYLLLRRAHFRIFVRQVIGSLSLQALASAALLGLGGWLVIQRQLTIGQLVAAELIVTVVVSGFAKFGKKLETFYDLSAAIDKLGQVIDLPLEPFAGKHLPFRDAPAAVRIDKAGFAFPSGPPILSNCSWQLEPGERVGLVGGSGAGKSTFADLLYGLRTPDSGTLTIDGFDYRDLSLQSLREHVAVVHEGGVFSGSVLENVALGRDEVDLDNVQEALATAGLLEDVRALPNGLESELSVHGRPLSPGQIVRLMIARAIVGQPRLLIIDGALDRIDDRRERERLAAVLLGPSTPWTAVCISSDPRVLAHCRRVCELRKGSIHEVSPGAPDAPASSPEQDS